MPTRTTTKKKQQHPMADLIPTMDRREAYLPRVIHGWEDLAWLEYADKLNRNVLIFGPTGPGKTHCIDAYGAAHNKPVVTIPCNGGMDTSTLFGRDVRRDGVWTWVDSPLVEVVRHGGIVHFSEGDRMPKPISAVFHSLTDDLRQLIVIENGGEVITASDDLFVVLTMNVGYGHQPMDPAFKNRFEIKLEFDYNPDLEQRIILGELAGQEDVTLAALMEFAGKVRKAAADGSIGDSISTRDLNRFVWLSVDMGWEPAVYNMLNNFDADDRQPVKDALEIHSSGIQAELAVIDSYLEEE